MTLANKTYKITARLGNQRFSVRSEKVTVKKKTGEINTETNVYTVDLKHNTCTCPHHVHRSTNNIYLECSHIAFVRERETMMKVKNNAHRFLADKGIEVKKVIKVTFTKRGMAVVVYELQNGGKGCTFFNYKKLINNGHFTFKRIDTVTERFAVYENNQYKCEIDNTPLGWQVIYNPNNFKICPLDITIYDFLVDNNDTTKEYSTRSFTNQKQINEYRLQFA